MTLAACKVAVHIEISIRGNCARRASDVAEVVREWLQRKCPVFKNGALALDSEMSSLTSSIIVADLPPGKCVSFWQADLCLHPFRLSEQGPENDCMEGEESLPAAEQWELPNTFLSNLWDSVVINSTIKARLLSYCSSSIRFSEAKVDTDVIAWNRMILLHGPPGTGKTTICKGLAQKTFIRNCDRFSSGMLLEVNSHSLFSKWFSESGKLVMKLFSHIAEIAEDEECMVVVLIDEVESITASRGSAARSNEPGDAVRVVNAVLTSLDALKRRPNVLVLCTSNLIASVDPAFLDRVDMKVHLGPPPVQARYDILRFCVVELMQKGIISPMEEVSSSCTSVEDHLLEQLLVRTPTGAGTGGTQKVSQRVRNNMLEAFVRSVAVPVLDDGGIFESEDDQYDAPMEGVGNDTISVGPQSSSEGAGSDGGNACGQRDWAGRDGGLYWPGSAMTQTQLESQQAVSNPSQADSSALSPLRTSTNMTADDDIGEQGGAGAAARERTAAGLQLSAEQYLYVVAALCEGMSGRALRKLPLKAHSYFVQSPTVTLLDFLGAMHATIEAERVMGTGQDLS